MGRAFLGFDLPKVNRELGIDGNSNRSSEPFDGIDGEEARLMFAAEVVLDAIEMERDVDFGDALKWAEAKSAE